MIVLQRRDFLIMGLLVLVVEFLGFILIPMSLKQTPIVIKPAVVILHEKITSEFEATGYYLGKPYDTITKSGAFVINKGAIKIGEIEIFTIAVDPQVIPLGSLVYIDSLGLAIATDTGPKIQGMKIDICFSDSQQALSWGKRKVMITMIRTGKE